jgi:hypothetical protein
MRNYILFMALSLSSAQAEISQIAALGMIETGNDDRAVGGAGEVSRYQIKPWIWRQYSQSQAYADRRISTEVAGKHLAVLEDTFKKRAGRAPTDFDIYVLWNAGPTYYSRIGFAKSRVHPVIQERARRFANLRRSNNAAPAWSVASKATTAARPSSSLKTASPASAVAAGSSPLWPLLPPSGSASLQNPMFSLLPLAAQPEAPSAAQQPIFAVGVIPAK